MVVRPKNMTARVAWSQNHPLESTKRTDDAIREIDLELWDRVIMDYIFDAYPLIKILTGRGRYAWRVRDQRALWLRFAGCRSASLFSFASLTFSSSRLSGTFDSGQNTLQACSTPRPLMLEDLKNLSHRSMSGQIDIIIADYVRKLTSEVGDSVRATNPCYLLAVVDIEPGEAGCVAGLFE